jgi:hypothetical protein
VLIAPRARGGTRSAGRAGCLRRVFPLGKWTLDPP